MITIMDNVVPTEIFKMAHQEVNKDIWSFSNMSTGQDLNVGFSAPIYCGEVNKLISEDKFNESNIMYNLWNSINSKLDVEKNYNNKLGRIFLNGGPPLSDQTVHRDDQVTYSKNITIVFFLHDRWEVAWGGELLLYDISHSRVTGGVFPMPNRAADFYSYLPHRGAPVSRICPIMRISIAFQCVLNND